MDRALLKQLKETVNGEKKLVEVNAELQVAKSKPQKIFKQLLDAYIAKFSSDPEMKGDKLGMDHYAFHDDKTVATDALLYDVMLDQSEYGFGREFKKQLDSALEKAGYYLEYEGSGVWVFVDINQSEAKVDEAKADDDAKSKATSELKSILRKIHKATTEEEVEQALDRLAKSAVNHDFADGKVQLLQKEVDRKLAKIRAGDKAETPEAETKEVEDKVEEGFRDFPAPGAEEKPVSDDDMLMKQQKAKEREYITKVKAAFAEAGLPITSKFKLDDVAECWYTSVPDVDEAELDRVLEVVNKKLGTTEMYPIFVGEDEELVVSFPDSMFQESKSYNESKNDCSKYDASTQTCIPGCTKEKVEKGGKCTFIGHQSSCTCYSKKAEEAKEGDAIQVDNQKTGRRSVGRIVARGKKNNVEVEYHGHPKKTYTVNTKAAGVHVGESIDNVNFEHMVEAMKKTVLKEGQDPEQVKRYRKEAEEYYAKMKISPTGDEILDYVADAIEDESGAEMDQGSYRNLAKQMGITIDEGKVHKHRSVEEAKKEEQK